MASLDKHGFGPEVAAWFDARMGAPTRPQAEGWPRIQAGEDVLIAAPTGSGKTLAAFLWALDGLVRRARAGELAEGTHVLYVSPLKALGNDVAKNLQVPLGEIAAAAAERGAPLPEIRVAVRSGDTPASTRQAHAKKPPHVWVTTPESLFILLTSGKGRAALARVDTVIVDEIHALVRDKRGSHLALSLERLDDLVARSGGRRPQRIGLSATQRPLELVAAFLGGASRPRPAIVDAGTFRELDLAIEIPSETLGSVTSSGMLAETCDRIAQLCREHRTTLVFVNTRRMVERLTRDLGQRLGEDLVAPHHGSLAKERRQRAEQRLKAGELRCVVATASLELGIDVGEVDLVVQIGSPRNIAVLLQRVGRSGHALGRVPKGRVFALTRDQLVEAVALARAIERGRLDALHIPETALDVLAQQLVATAATDTWPIGILWALVRRAWPYRDLGRPDFDAVMEMLAEGVARGSGRRTALLFKDGVEGTVVARRGAKLLALTSGGTIPETAQYGVVAEPDEALVGTVDEDFAVESMVGDVFLLGSTSWRVRRVETTRLRVEDARGQAPNVPFWRGEAPGRTRELSAEVGELRREVELALAAKDTEAVATELASRHPITLDAARQLVGYLAYSRALLGQLPTQDTIVAERFFDDGGGMQLIIHAPFGARIDRAFGLALRKKFCRSFDFELQAAATDEALLLSLGPVHSFPLEEVFEFVKSKSVRETLEQAVLRTPYFTSRWRWSAQRALAIARYVGGKKVPPFLLRMRSDDLLVGVFPLAVACQDNLTGGDLPLPDHPLIKETMRDCLEEAMDVPGLIEVLQRIERGEIRCLAKDTPEPSPLSHELINASPWAFLDDAPLEERRTRAVQLRRTLPEEIDKDLAALDPEAIAEVAAQTSPLFGSELEVIDALLEHQWIAARPGVDAAEALVARGRVVLGDWGRGRYWVPLEHVPLVRAVFPAATFAPEPRALSSAAAPPDREAIVVRALRAHLASAPPHTEAALAARLGLEGEDVRLGLAQLEAAGAVLQGHFTPGEDALEWCEKNVLARIHRRTLNRLRKSVEPVSLATFMRFLFRWQRVLPNARARGKDGLSAVLGQLQGFDAAAPAWEAEILPARVEGYTPGLLDELGHEGGITWARLRGSPAGDGAQVTRSARLTLAKRDALPWLLAAHEPGEPDELTPVARAVEQALAQRGAMFARDLAASLQESPSAIFDALRELAAAGLITGDGFAGLRALIGGGRAVPPGRFSLLTEGVTSTPDPVRFADLLLARYGVVFADLLGREIHPPRWRLLLRELRRKEAQGLVRGGRFVAGITGEQYALPEAVELLRGVRNAPRGEIVRVSACDPLNLAGVILPGPRVPAVLGQELVFEDGALRVRAARAEPEQQLDGPPAFA